MSRTVELARAMAYPVHPKSWSRPAGSPDYRITADWDDPDPINGGEHHAIDLGNFRSGDAVYSPAPCMGIGRRHVDGALGVVLELGGGWSLELWHLSVLYLSTGGQRALGDRVMVGRTGATGLGTGAHTHAELKWQGARVDPEPYFLGTSALVIDEDSDMQLPVGEYLAWGDVGPGVNLRSPAPRDQLAGSGPVVDTTDERTTVALLYRRPSGAPYSVTINGVVMSSRAWYGCKLPGPDMVEVAALLVGNRRPTPYLADIVNLGEAERRLLIKMDRARSHLAAAVGPQSEVTSRLSKARQELEP